MWILSVLFCDSRYRLLNRWSVFWRLDWWSWSRFLFFLFKCFLRSGWIFSVLVWWVLLLDCFTLMGLWEKHTFLDLFMVIGRHPCKYLWQVIYVHFFYQLFGLNTVPCKLGWFGSFLRNCSTMFWLLGKPELDYPKSYFPSWMGLSCQLLKLRESM